MKTELKAAVALAVLVFALLALTAAGNVAGGDAELCLLLARNLLDGRVSVDPHFELLPGRNGEYYLWQDPGLALLITPVTGLERLADATGLPRRLRVNVVSMLLPLFSPCVTTVAAVVYFFWQLRCGTGMTAALAAALLAVFATQLWPSAVSFYNDAPQACLMLAGMYGFLTRRYRVAGILFLLLVLTKSVNLVLMLPLLLVAWRRRREPGIWRGSMATGAGFVIAGVLLLGYNWMRFGDPFLGGYQVQALHYGLRFGTFSTPLGDGLYGLLASPGKGLLLFSPPVLLALLGWRRLTRNFPDDAILALGGFAVLLVAVAKYWGWHGDYAWGPRLLTAGLLPVLLPLGLVIRDARGRGLRLCVTILAVAGVFMQLLGMYFSPGFPTGAIYASAHGIDIRRLETRDPWSDFHFDPAWSPILTHLRVMRAQLITGEREIIPYPGAEAVAVPRIGEPRPWLLRLAARGGTGAAAWLAVALLLAAAAGSAMTMLRVAQRESTRIHDGSG